MKRLLTLAVGLCVLAARAPAQEIRISMPSAPKAPGRAYAYWTVFEHPRFGYELPVPPGMRSLGHPAAANESTFVSQDGAIKITAWGGLSPQPAAAVLEAEWRNARRQAGRTITYGSKGPAWFVLSGIKNGNTRFCEKLFMRGDHVAAFSVSWPQFRAREFADWVRKIDSGFTLVSDPEYGVPEIAAHVLTTSPAVNRDAIDQTVDPLTLEEWRQADLVAPSVPPLETQTSAISASPRSRNSTTVDLTLPGKLFAVDAALETLPDAPAAAAPEDTPVTTKESPPPAPEMPVGEHVPGKKGFVYSPFLTDKMLVDAVDIASGTKVKCPYTNKIFRLP